MLLLSPSIPAILLSSLVVVSISACRGDKTRDPSAPATSASPRTPATSQTGTVPSVAPKGAGTIRGTVLFTGDPPTMPALKRDADPACAKTKMTAETILVNENKTLRNVVVRIKPGTATGPAPTQTVNIKQTECMYRPRVQAVHEDQRITISNNDPTMHNVHGFDMRVGEGETPLFNLAHPPKAPDIQKDAAGYEVIKLKCDVHPWMAAYVVVTDHPYFDVTGEDGTFKLENVPPGTYTLEAWHEFYGMKTAQAAFTSNGTATAEFTFDASEKAL